MNNQKGNVSRNSKNISKISIISNNNGNLSISSKKQIDFKKQKNLLVKIKNKIINLIFFLMCKICFFLINNYINK